MGVWKVAVQVHLYRESEGRGLIREGTETGRIAISPASKKCGVIIPTKQRKQSGVFPQVRNQLLLLLCLQSRHNTAIDAFKK